MARRLFLSLLLAFLAACPFRLWGEEPEAEEQPAPPAAPVAKYNLKYKFTPGEAIRTEVVHRATVQTTIQGTTQKADTSSRSIKVWKVEDVDADGTVSFSYLVEHIDMWQRSSGRTEVRFNSDDDGPVPPGYEEVAKSVGTPLSVIKMDPRGNILDRQQTHDQPVAMSTQVTMPLPDGPISLGESWTSPQEMDVAQKDGTPKKIQTRQKFTLESVEDGIATIKVDAQVLTPINDPAIEAQLIQRLSDGSVRFDIEAGRMLSQLLEVDKHVIGFSGPASSMHYVTRFTEKLLGEEEAQTARRSADETR
jgi:hypothetical protein